MQVLVLLGDHAEDLKAGVMEEEELGATPEQGKTWPATAVRNTLETGVNPPGNRRSRTALMVCQKS
jgi:hypothetical protein